MWEYVSTPTTKKPVEELDTAAWTSSDHPAPEDLPMPRAELSRAWAARGQGGPKRARGGEGEALKVLDFYDVLKENRETVKDEEDLWNLARAKQEAGDRRLMQFLLSRRDLPQLLERVAKAEGAPENARRAQLSRVEILEDTVARGTCACPVPGRWKAAANEVVANNGYTEQELETAILEALDLGRGKQRNIFVVGPTNRAKSFCLKPLALVYRAYVSPDTGTHQLADLRGAEVLWLNDFEYDAQFIPWRKLKDFLEGEPLKVAVPKTQGTNYMFESNAPVFGTAPGPIEHPTQQRETVQMDSRMRYFLFEHFFDPATSPDIKPCAVCFAEWLLAARARPRGPPGRPPVGLSRYYGRAQKTKKQAWVVQKAAGTYEHDDLPGACFRCGGFGHLAIDCPMQASSGSSGDNPGRAGVICPRCGAARKCQGDAFCSHCGSPF